MRGRRPPACAGLNNLKCSLLNKLLLDLDAALIATGTLHIYNVQQVVSPLSDFFFFFLPRSGVQTARARDFLRALPALVVASSSGCPPRRPLIRSAKQRRAPACTDLRAAQQDDEHAAAARRHSQRCATIARPIGAIKHARHPASAHRPSLPGDCATRRSTSQPAVIAFACRNIRSFRRNTIARWQHPPSNTKKCNAPRMLSFLYAALAHGLIVPGMRMVVIEAASA